MDDKGNPDLLTLFPNYKVSVQRCMVFIDLTNNQICITLNMYKTALRFI